MVQRSVFACGLQPLCVCVGLALCADGPAVNAHADPLPPSLRHHASTARAGHRHGTDLIDRAARPPQRTTTAIVVQNCNDSGPGSLREAYSGLVDGGVIDLTQLDCSTITLTTGALSDPESALDVSLLGPGRSALTINGNHAGRVLVHNGDNSLRLYNLTVSNGSYSGSQGGGFNGSLGGGCIYSTNGVVISYSTVMSCAVSSTGAASAYGGAIYANGYVQMHDSTVIGSSAHSASANSAGGGIFGSTVSMSGSTISGNTVSGDGGHFARGGGFFAFDGASIEHSTISGNHADSGAGAFLGDVGNPVPISESTISGNHANGAAGGVYSIHRGLLLSNSTIAQNTADFPFGAGLYVGSSTDLQSTIVANNSSQDGLSASDIGGPSSATLTGANNLIVASTLAVPPDTLVAAPMLGPLADNGGLTWTQALLPGSPAIDHGNNVAASDSDQRRQDPHTGEPYQRVVGPSADIGAYEFGARDHIFANGFDLAP